MRRTIFILFPIFFAMHGFSQLLPGQQAPDLSLPDRNGDTVHLSSLRGKVVLVDFWASWCGPCRRNNPRLAALYRKYHSKGLEIFGISLDAHASDWMEAVHKDRMVWIQVNDNGGWEARSAMQYGIDAIPAAFLIDRNGVLLQAGAEGKELESELKRLLQ
jgi:peroxiredoxin